MILINLLGFKVVENIAERDFTEIFKFDESLKSKINDDYSENRHSKNAFEITL